MWLLQGRWVYLARICLGLNMAFWLGNVKARFKGRYNVTLQMHRANNAPLPPSDRIPPPLLPLSPLFLSVRFPMARAIFNMHGGESFQDQVHFLA